MISATGWKNHLDIENERVTALSLGICKEADPISHPRVGQPVGHCEGVKKHQ